MRKRRPAKWRLATTIDKYRRDDVAKVRRATRATNVDLHSLLRLLEFRHFRALPETRHFLWHPNRDWGPIFVHLKWD